MSWRLRGEAMEYDARLVTTQNGEYHKTSNIFCELTFGLLLLLLLLRRNVLRIFEFAIGAYDEHGRRK